MKKIKLIISLLVLCVFINCNNVFASTKVNTRSEGNYLVPSDVVVTESIKQDIMSTPAINAEEKVYDFADILTKDEEDKLYKHVKNFVDGANMDYVIVTTSKNNKASASKYARDFYDYNDFSNDGILLLIDMDNRSIYMLTSGNAYNLFPDSRMKPILENVFSKIKEKKYYDACKSFTTSISQFVKIGLVSDDEGVVKVGEDGSVLVKKDLHLLEVFVFALIGTLVIIGILVLSSRMVRKATSAKNFLNKETMKIINISEMSLGSQTYKKLLSSDNNSFDKKNNGPNQGGTGINF